MDPSLRTLLDRLADEFREVREGVRKAVDIADRDPEMALTQVRKVLELVVHEVYQRRLAEPPGTRPWRTWSSGWPGKGTCRGVWSPTPTPSACWTTSAATPSARPSPPPTCGC
jgi:hypothetical protein